MRCVRLWESSVPSTVKPEMVEAEYALPLATRRMMRSGAMPYKDNVSFIARKRAILPYLYDFECIHRRI